MTKIAETRPHARITTSAHLDYERVAFKNDFEIQNQSELYHLSDLMLKAKMISMSEFRVLTIIIKRSGFDNDIHGGLFFARNSYIAKEAALSEESCASRLLRGLRDKGIITALDSSNCSRGEQNFGYSLNICHARFVELKQAAEGKLRDFDRIRLLRKKYQSCKKRIPAMLQLEQFIGFEELLLSQWEEAVELVNNTKERLKKVSASIYADAITILQMAIDKVNKDVSETLKQEDMSCGHDNSPIHNTNTTLNSAVYCSNKMNSANAEHSNSLNAANRGKALEDDKDENSESTSDHVTLGMVFTACPSLKDTHGNYTKNWGDFIKHNETLRLYLGISPSLMQRAQKVLPAEFLGVAMAIVLQKTTDNEVSSPGGYFKGMIDKAHNGDLHLAPTIHGLMQKSISNGMSDSLQ